MVSYLLLPTYRTSLDLPRNIGYVLQTRQSLCHLCVAKLKDTRAIPRTRTILRGRAIGAAVGVGVCPGAF